MKVIVALDSFKGSATSMELNDCVKKAIRSVLPVCDVQSFPIADGGEGSLDALHSALGGQRILVETVDLLGRSIVASYLLVGQTAFIESASVVGIDKIVPSSETFERASSYGLGALVEDAAESGCKEIIMTLGGSGTSDGGRGLLDYFSFDAENGHLSLPDKWGQISLVGLTDVDHFYAGEEGYARVFGRQKGGTDEQLALEDERSMAFASKVKKTKGCDLLQIAGTGAAGGLGGALVLLGGRLESGFERIASLVGLEEAILSADLVITGEGRLDSQSSHGKVPSGVASLARKYQVPTIAICGAVDHRAAWIWDDFVSVFSIQTGVISLQEAMKKETTLENLSFVVQNIMRTRYL